MALLRFAATLALAAPALAQGTSLGGAGDGAAEPSVGSWRRLESWFPDPERRPPYVGERALELGDARAVVWIGNARMAVGESLDLPDALRKPEPFESAFLPGWFVVHFERVPTGADRDALDALLGEVRGRDGSRKARWYVPNDAFGVWIADAATLAELAALDGVDAVLRHQPAYKISPRIGTFPLRSPGRRDDPWLRLHLDVAPGASVAAIRAELLALGVEWLADVWRPMPGLYDVQFVVARAAPELVPAIARVEGIRWIEEAGDGPALHDLSAAGKLQARSLAADSHAAATGPALLNATDFPLWVARDLQGQGQLIGIVDTSLDHDNSETAGATPAGCASTASTGAFTADGGVVVPTEVSNHGFADPVAATAKLPSIGPGGVSLKVPRVDLLSGAVLNREPILNDGMPQVEIAGHGTQVAASAAADFVGGEDRIWYERDGDFPAQGGVDFVGVLGPGIAKEAQLYFTPVFNDSDDVDTVFAWSAPGAFEANLSTTLGNMANADCCATVHSTGIVQADDTYTAVSVVHDTTARAFPWMLQCVAAGNQGATPHALTSQAVTKNALTVGGSDDVLKPNDRMGQSSIGPRFDGALKPDLLVPGTDTFPRAGGNPSRLVLPGFNGASDPHVCEIERSFGTSFSAPIAAGAAALVHQYFEEGHYGPGNANTGGIAVVDPSAALMKAMLVQSCVRLTGNLLGNGAYPSGFQGWGEPKLDDVLVFGGGPRTLLAYDAPSPSVPAFASAGDPSRVFRLDVVAQTEPLRATLVWTDAPGSMGLGKKLVNDLHLELVAPGGTTVFRGNVFDTLAGASTAGGAPDTDDNVEVVLVQFPSLGTWTVRVVPSAGPFAGGQGFGLAVTGAIAELGIVEPATFSFDAAGAVAPNPTIELQAGQALPVSPVGGLSFIVGAGEDVALQSLALDFSSSGVGDFAPFRLYADADSDGVVDDPDAPLAAGTVAGDGSGVTFSTSGAGIVFAAGGTTDLLLTIGDGLVVPAGQPFAGASFGPLLAGLLAAAAVLGATGALARRVRRALRVAGAGAAALLALAVIACSSGGGGGGPAFGVSVTGSDVVVQGQQSFETIDGGASAASFGFDVVTAP